MNKQNRRAFLQNSAAAAALVAMRGVAAASSISEARRDGSHSASVVETPRSDLLVKGGHVIDPANERDGSSIFSTIRISENRIRLGIPDRSET